MPYVNIKVTNEGVSKDQKSALIAGVTQLLVDVLHKNPSTTVVVIDEVEMENWGMGGLPVESFRRQSAPPEAPGERVA
ncbi:MAG: 4-oxalocrotonate tautomerase family protein [Halioglobus sp.]